MEIKSEITDSKGSFIAQEGEDKIGEMTFSVANEGQLFIVDHTEVSEKYKGKGIGQKLFDELVNSVRKAEVKVMPLCPFVRRMFEKNPDTHDVLRHGSL
ncbi:MAG: GNAT family N-acetyltransferase [Ekhidna sp.]